ncbi:Leucine Rich Repeat [Seminavis robusta]|uniref:Leucine Rich Repeat n=1 Tax=Seminavis robusta TaxID=568900 RepID=A0A9N8H793_9STRA|nr:Leucine Rich Repeat [Seminavis robusta]|eukprot:Sro134_g063470.1 Leucine Rich Repeat (246) ;mRNA; r:56395-57132
MTPVPPTVSPTMPPTTVPPTMRPVSLSDLLPSYSKLALVDPASPQSNARTCIWVEAHPEYNAMGGWRKLQLFSLVTIYYAMGGPVTWSENTRGNWLDATIHECFWPETSPNCVDNQSYQRLKFDGDGGIVGMISPEIGLLTLLTSLELERWAPFKPDGGLTKSIPTTIGLLTALSTIQISNNPFTGFIPTEIGLLTLLSFLRCGSGAFRGPFPTQIGLLTAMEYLYFAASSMTGTLPSELGLMLP